MRGLVVRRLGDPAEDGTLEVTEVRDLPSKVPRGRVRVRVMIVSLNYADSLQVRGSYQERKEPPFVCGSELSGVVESVGEGVVGWRPGDKVCGLSSEGALVERIDIPAGVMFRVSEGVPMEEAASAPVVMGTAWMALVQRANMSSNSTVLVLGGAGGVGSAAVSICAAMGVRVVATATSEEKAEYVRSLGASEVVLLSRKQRDMRSVVAQIRGVVKKPVDIVLDNVGGDLLDAGLKSLRWGGQLCIVGFASGKIPSLVAGQMLVKNWTVHGIYWGGHLVQGYPQPVRESVEAAMSLLSSRRVRIQCKAYDLKETKRAFADLQKGQVQGKLVVNMSKIGSASL